MTKYEVVCSVSVVLIAVRACVGFAESGPPKPDMRPNFIVIMADDMGYSDLGCYGGEIRTPNLDRLAAGGLRFTQFYNCAKCNPSRASLLTGSYDQAVGVGNMEFGVTMGEVLGSAGYRTLCAGKWHQGPLPTTRGFDRYFGLADGCCNFWNPGTEAREGEPPPGRKWNRARRWAIEGEAIKGYTPEDKDFYTTDAFTTYAIDRLKEYADEGKPFLLYLPYTAPHYPLHAWPEDIARYRGRYRIGWDELRRRRYERMTGMGIFDKRYRPAPRDPDVPPWEELSDEKKDELDLTMSVYAAMVDRMDQNIGRLLKALDEVGKTDNTLVLFFSDNGGCSENVNTTPAIPPGPVGSYRTLGRPWANATNTPYRKYKATDYEGGACTPCIASWPGHIKPNTITSQVGHLIDILPTLAELAGARHPDTFDGRAIKPMNGQSLVPVLEGRVRPGHDVLFWHYGAGRAVRQGDWKLVKLGKKDWELYNLAEDRTELDNLAADHPERVGCMQRMWEEWKGACREGA